MDKLVFDINKVKVVPINDVVPNDWNPKDVETEEYNTLVRGIRQDGLRLPIVVREHGNGYQIIDGEQRYRACGQLGYKNVLIYNEGQVEDKRAKELTIWYQHQVPFNEVALAGLIKQLGEEFDFKDLHMPFTDEQMQNYADMANFDFTAFDEDESALTEDHLDMKSYKVTAQQKAVIDDAIEAIRQDTDNPEISDGRAIELMAADYLAGRQKEPVEDATEEV